MRTPWRCSGCCFQNQKRKPATSDSAPADSTILCILPDTGERYLSMPLFEGIAQDMDAEEMAISKSTPGFQRR